MQICLWVNEDLVGKDRHLILDFLLDNPQFTVVFKNIMFIIK